MTEYGDLHKAFNNYRDPWGENRSTLHFFVLLFGVFIIFVYVFTQILIGVRVDGASMEPTLHDNDYLFICTTASVQYEDIVVFSRWDETQHNWKQLIKRVVGLPGDVLRAEDGVLYRKEEGTNSFCVVDESYLGFSWTKRNSFDSITVPQDAIFVMGDNRDDSSDSRTFGPVPVSNVMGVVTDWSFRYKVFFTNFFEIFSINQK